MVSQAIALNPVDREAFFLTNDSNSRVIDWTGIFRLAQLDDYPFNI
mgnify:CR=1 FL=1